MRMRTNVVLLPLLMVVLALGASGCWGPDGTQEVPVSQVIDEAEVRTDRDPLMSRFPLLGSFVEARWVGGVLGDQRVPGPSTYFVEAVVTLAPADVERMRTAYRFDAAPAPEVPAALRSAIGPDPDWSSSAEFDAALPPSDWVGHASIDLTRGIAYVSARGE